MYCIKKFADCWAIYNLDNEESRPLTEAEVQVARENWPQLDDPQTAALYMDRVECIGDKP